MLVLDGQIEKIVCLSRLPAPFHAFIANEGVGRL